MDRRHPARPMRHAAQRTCRRSMLTATAALVTTMSRPSSLAGSHRVSLPISSQGAAKDCALSLTWSGRAAENAGLLKRQHRSRSQRRFPEDALVANVGCRRRAAGQKPWPIRLELPRSGRLRILVENRLSPARGRTAACSDVAAGARVVTPPFRTGFVNVKTQLGQWFRVDAFLEFRNRVLLYMVGHGSGSQRQPELRTEATVPRRNGPSCRHSPEGIR